MSVFAGRNLRCVRGERAVFDGVDFAMDAGDALLLTGANGSGKSSLLRLMTGLLRPAKGTILWRDAPIADDPDDHRLRLAFVGHLDAVKPALTAAENLAFWTGLAGQAAAGSVTAALDAFGIRALAEVPCRFLSAGQKRRVALARLCVRPAALWLLDEPATALDAAAQARLGEAVARHRAGGGLVVAATHSDLDWGDARSLDLGAGAWMRAAS